MKCKFTFEVKGFFKIPVGINFNIGDYFYEIVKIDNKIYLSVTISNYPMDAIPTIIENKQGPSKASITIPSSHIKDDVISNIRTFEGTMSMWGMQEIDTEKYKIEWIPETDEEKSKIHIYNFSISIHDDNPDSYPDAPLDLFIRALLSIDNLKTIETPLNFYRRGFLDYRSEKYIDAIYDLFFVFETLFAKGKFKKSQVKKEFNSSDILVESIQHVKNKIGGSTNIKNNLLLQVKEIYLKKTNEDIIDHIVELRGFLHHHTSSRLDIWHPAQQRQYKHDAYFLLEMCHHILMDMAIKVMFKNEITDEIKTIKVKTDKGGNVGRIIQGEI